MTRSGRVTRRPRELQQVPKGSKAKIKRHREASEGGTRAKLAKNVVLYALLKVSSGGYHGAKS